MRLRPASGPEAVQLDRMKIVHVIPALTKGGAERVVIDLANAAASRGHEVAVLVAVAAPSEHMPGQLGSKVELRVISRKAASVRSSYARAVGWMLRHRRWLLSRDIVHCHLTFGAVFGTLLQIVRALSRSRTPAVVETYHAVGMPIPRRERAVHGALLGRRDAVAFMADDPYWRRFAERRQGGLFRTIPNGIAGPPPVSAAQSERYRAANTRIPSQRAAVVGSVSRLVPARRPDQLLRSFARIAAVLGSDVHFLLAGDGPERASLEAQAGRLGLASQVHMPGLALDPAEPISLMDLYLSVNVGSITGIAALEAASLGVPVIALQLRQDYVCSPSDWIWSSADPELVAKRAIELLGDRGRLRALAEKQQAHAKADHGAEAMAAAYDKLYAAALASARSTAFEPETSRRTVHADRER